MKKKPLLREIADRIASGSEILEAKKIEKEQKKKDEKKKLSLLKQGKDLRLRAMRTLKNGGQCNFFFFFTKLDLQVGAVWKFSFSTGATEDNDESVGQGDAPGENESNSDDNKILDVDDSEKEKDVDTSKADNPPKAKSK